MHIKATAAGRDEDRGMSDTSDASRFATALAVAAMLLLSAMVAVTAITGVAQEPFELVRPDYTAAIAAAAGPLQIVVALDGLFLIAYTGFFVVVPRALGVADDPSVKLAVRIMIAVAVLDVVEDQHLVAMARTARDGTVLSAVEITATHVLSQAKFHLSYLALALLALGLPRRTRAERAFAWMMGLPMPLAGALAWVSPALDPVVSVARWLGFMGGFAGAIAVLRARSARGRAVVAAATGAPA